MNDTEQDIARVLAAALLTDQRRRWQAGERPAVEDYLVKHPTLSADLDGVLDLIYQEIFLREECGEAAAVDEYLQRFPQWADDIRLQFEVHEAIVPEPAPDTASPAPPPGYELQGEIGRGAMGIVYRARDVTRERTVAIKLLRPEHFHIRSALKRFLAEARAVVRLAHPHIVAVHEIGESAASPFLVMDLIAGPSLATALSAGPMPIAEAIATLLPVAEAVDYAHRRGVIHRDLKPSNILLDPVRGPVVLDFGMAKVQRDRGKTSLSSWTQPGTVLGTPAFMPPEQTGVEQPEIGPPSDVYSLGAILYAMLTGRPPFVEATVLLTIRKVRSALPVPVRRLRADVPEAMERVCQRCLEKQPAERYPSALMFADALRALQGGDDVSTVDMPSQPFLIDEATGQRIHFVGRRTLVGRATDCDVTVKDPRISRHHCRVVVDAQGAEVEDLGSSWGTFVNGERVHRARLKDGDRIEFGGKAFLFRRPD